MDKVLEGYSEPMGRKWSSVFNHFGPKSYQTGGESLNCRHLGFAAIDWISPFAVSLSGLYYAWVLFKGNAASSSQTDVIVQWFSFSTASEVFPGTDLSGETLRLLAFGV